MLLYALLSSLLRLFAGESKATRRPVPDMDGANEPSLAPAPPAPVARLASVVVFMVRSRTKMLR